MTEPKDEFRTLLEQAQAGSREATCELIERYGPHIVRAVRRKLDRALRSKFDSIDFVQAVWASFFTASRRLTDFHTPQDLIAYLVAMARNKVISEIRRRLMRPSHNVNREYSLDSSRWAGGARLPDGGPSPSAVAVASELRARLLDGRPVLHQRIIQLRLDGYSTKQIARMLGIHQRTVQRVIARLAPDRVGLSEGTPDEAAPGQTAGDGTSPDED
ncbi:MAG TPA: sigma-70 family RNA polymerase sigma factor [Planctomycetaceae bacterium]|nr:sigma-70 family RNA polymerase sigma factor [Planctomycetaceae bacterium]